MHFKAFVGVIFATALSGIVARAETVSFGFTDLAQKTESSFTYAHASGLSLLVTGSNQIGSIISPAFVSRSYSGLGVVGFPKGDPSRLDHLGSVESLIFDFAPYEVVVNQMSFNFIDARHDDDDDDHAHDDFKLTVIGNGTQTEYDISTQGVGSVNFDFRLATPLLNAEQRTGMKFIASTTDCDDNYTITGMTVDFERAGPPVVVPGPSAILGGGALLALSGFRLWAKKRHGSEVV